MIVWWFIECGARLYRMAGPVQSAVGWALARHGYPVLSFIVVFVVVRLSSLVSAGGQRGFDPIPTPG